MASDTRQIDHLQIDQIDQIYQIDNLQTACRSSTDRLQIDQVYHLPGTDRSYRSNSDTSDTSITDRSYGPSIDE